MTDKNQTGWATTVVIILFVIYEVFTIVFQFLFLFTGDLIELGFDLLFILLLVFFYDVDALILLIELIPFVDIIPLFAIYMIMKVATANIPRKPLINMKFNFFKLGKEESQQSRGSEIEASYVVTEEDKIYQAESNEEVCVICMRTLQDGDEVVTCRNGHLAHVTHIQPWTESMDREICPMCRIRYPKVLISKTYRLKSNV